MEGLGKILPRNTDVKALREENFDEVLDNYNDTPRKNLDWVTPNEVFQKNLSCVAHSYLNMALNIFNTNKKLYHNI